jgi:hypothetical protein
MLVEQGAKSLLNRAVMVDGEIVRPRWISGAPSAGNANGLDAYSFVIMKLSNSSFRELASLSQFK